MPAVDIELPLELSQLIAPTLESEPQGYNREIVISPGERHEVNLRVSCLPFFSERNILLGAVLVLNDHTAIERLQRQVRQADRLASIGTLASGMAHEIKNPLTTLKTFTQLLPATLPGRRVPQRFHRAGGRAKSRASNGSSTSCSPSRGPLRW